MKTVRGSDYETAVIYEELIDKEWIPLSTATLRQYEANHEVISWNPRSEHDKEGEV